MFILVNWTHHAITELVVANPVEAYGKGHEDGLAGDDVTVYEATPEGIVQRYPAPEPEPEPEPETELEHKPELEPAPGV